MTFSSSQLRAIQGLVTVRLTYDCGDALARWQGLLRETEAQIAAVAPRELVFRLDLPIEPVTVKYTKKGKPVLVPLCPTLNVYAGMLGWKRAQMRSALDERIAPLRAAWPRWHCGVQVKHKIVGEDLVETRVAGTGRRRLVRVVRRSSRRVDEVTADVCGAKAPIDRLVQAQILVGDSARWLEREAAWEPCDPGDGRVIVEVYELPASLAAPRAHRGSSKTTR